MKKLEADIFKFLNELSHNNHRDWMAAHKKTYLANEKLLKSFYSEVQEGLNRFDKIDKIKVFRINRDIRFSKDKTPYNIHRSAGFSRLGKERRGSYYLRIESGNKSRIGGGFFGPEPKDLRRIRAEFSSDSTEIRSILNNPAFAKAYGGFQTQDAVKTAPKGFSKDDPNIDLIRLKSFVVSHSFTDTEVLSSDFCEKVIEYYKLLLPYFNYMSDVLTTDANGESLLD